MDALLRSIEHGTTAFATAFPEIHFAGPAAKELITRDNTHHPLNAMISLKAIDYEISTIIDPCLKSVMVLDEAKNHLTEKKRKLEEAKKVFSR